MTTTPALHEIDLGDPDTYAAPDWGLAVFRRLREGAPIFWNGRGDRQGFWALTRYRDAVDVYRDARSFTSERGVQVGQAETAAVAAAGRMLIVADGEHHRRLRAVLEDRLRPSLVAGLEPVVRRALVEALGDHTGGAAFDFFAAVACRLPLCAICELLGVPRADWELILEWTRAAFASEATAERYPEKAEANASIFAYCADLLAERRRRPGGDLLSHLAAARLDGRPLDDHEILLNLNGLLTGGGGPASHAAAGAVVALSERPDEWRRLRDDPSLVGTAVEEVLRWTAPSLNVMRTALRDVTIGSERVRAGERVSVWPPAVNRDEAAFPRPETFDVGRAPNRHLTFGLGHHFCVGASLARLELRVLLEELTRRVHRLEPAGPITRLRSNMMWGFERVPMRLLPKPAG